MDTADEAERALTPEALFKAAQNPSAWLMSAERLSAAAELILQDQVGQEVSYFRAVDQASHKALAAAIMAADGTAHAEIKCKSPNYLPAQLLYAFAIENVFKGLAMANHPGLTGARKIGGEIKSHDLVKLAKAAKFHLADQEIPVVTVLSQIAEWAGRYPVAIELDKYVGKYPLGQDPQSLLDWGAQHPIMQRCFMRAADELAKKLPDARIRFGSVVVVRPRTGESFPWLTKIGWWTTRPHQ